MMTRKVELLKTIILLLLLAYSCFGCANAKVSYQITKTVEGNGKVDVVSSAKEGEEIEVCITAEPGHYLSSFKVNNKELLDDVKEGIYLISDISGDKHIKAQFSPGVIYATEKPIIDGNIDVCWGKAAKLYANNRLVEVPGEGKFQNTGYVSVMWDEQYLYYLGVVEDGDITTEDHINFWISETYYTDFDTNLSFKYPEDKAIPYPSDEMDGIYYLAINPYGEQFFYRTIEEPPYFYAVKGGLVDFSTIGGYECKTRIFEEDKGGYIVEMKIPKQRPIEWNEGHFLGFDVSIDTHYTGDINRAIYNGHELYCNWNGVGAYWEDARQLGKLRFCK